MDTLVYKIGNNLYINLTNRCTNRCTFCVREQSAQYEGYSLWLKEGEPSAEQVIDLIGDPKAYDEIVFCGYGEPTYRLSVIKAISDYVHSLGGRTRMNTNGHGNVINGRNIAGELRGRLDGINISLNSPSAQGYEAVCRPQIKDGFGAMIDFAKDCRAAGLNCWFSVVDCIGKEQVEECEKIAREVGIPLRVREFIDNTKQG
ncbi:MAG: TatD family nuclease-associated radical SAM protein [Candidatus Coproplasma sp.]